ncbi:Cys-tRNA(Pro) deacylase [Amphritea sp. 2_MG-2023]|jgi:Cys-tRNA(Pro)/Cys-tRNA(Cys) deacylase|uniref:Cys-tRNA(Pro) deacylase n=1 Tax=Amphritea TaxID=515417 RepID=UPI001C07C4CE|nr:MULTISPECIES: Cys-tRNA(Pro) deacylase [Amphritea]MBU2964201.1 Cys-tRNA(Pro) deacylase [Amphritea atlantica]MDO6419542.1 Cys-tRNA(Pro) deacylase [Amphritea sp. 2_MG-2023]MDX2422676.1 Cys-tRNA(Pro) deacylase [Amphritea sp.]
MTPAIKLAKRAKINFTLHEYDHDADCESYGDEAAEALNVSPQRVYKTLMVALNGDNRQLAVAIVPVVGQLNLKATASALKAKKVTMAEPQQAQRSSGYLVGGISPLGQKKRLATLLDESAKQFDTIFVSAGKRGLEVELSPADLLQLTDGMMADIGR